MAAEVAAPGACSRPYVAVLALLVSLSIAAGVAVSLRPSFAAPQTQNNTTTFLEETPTAPPRRFVILTTQRSGSTWLVQELDQHPEIRCLGEVFNHHKHIKTILKEVYAEMYHNWSIHKEMLEDIYASSSEPLVGFKQHYHYIGSDIREKFFQWVVAHNVSVVHLVRRSRLEMFISHMFARGEQYYHRYADEKVIRVKPIHIDVDDFLKYAQLREEECSRYRYELESRRGVQYYELQYEAYARPEHTAAHMRALYAFLGVKDVYFRINTTETVQKVNFQTCKERVSNWDELRASLMQTHPHYIWLCERSAEWARELQ